MDRSNRYRGNPSSLSVTDSCSQREGVSTTIAIRTGIVIFATVLCSCATSQTRGTTLGAGDRRCPAPSRAVDTTRWARVVARNAPFTIRLPEGAEDGFSEHAETVQIWRVPSPKGVWDVVYFRPGPVSDADPAAAPTVLNKLHTQRIDSGPCTETIGGRAATVWVGEWVSRGTHSHLPHQVVVSWELEPGRRLFLLAQTANRDHLSDAIAAVRTVRFDGR